MQYEQQIPRRRPKLGSPSLIEDIRNWCKDQKELWQQIPHLALQANSMINDLDAYSRAYRAGYWEIQSSLRGDGTHGVYVDLTTGDLVGPKCIFSPSDMSGGNTPSHNLCLATDGDVVLLIGDLNEIDAGKVIASLKRAAQTNYFSAHDPLEQRAWRQKEADLWEVRPIYERGPSWGFVIDCFNDSFLGKLTPEELLKEAQGLRMLLREVRSHDEATYMHCLRVGRRAYWAGKRLIDGSGAREARGLLYAGLLHDFGKTLIPHDVLQKSGFEFTDVDFARMKAHVFYGYLMLKGDYPFSAEILLRHHRFQQHAYPEKLPPINPQYDKETVERCARVLALVDFYDAHTTRKDRKKVADACVCKALVAEYRDETEALDILFREDIFHHSTEHQ